MAALGLALDDCKNVSRRCLSDEDSVGSSLDLEPLEAPLLSLLIEKPRERVGRSLAVGAWVMPTEAMVMKVCDG
jgi:hypothetical protein